MEVPHQPAIRLITNSIFSAIEGRAADPKAGSVCEPYLSLSRSAGDFPSHDPEPDFTDIGQWARLKITVLPPFKSRRVCDSQCHFTRDHIAIDRCIQRMAECRHETSTPFIGRTKLPSFRQFRQREPSNSTEATAIRERRSVCLSGAQPVLTIVLKRPSEGGADMITELPPLHLRHRHANFGDIILNSRN